MGYRIRQRTALGIALLECESCGYKQYVEHGKNGLDKARRLMRRHIRVVHPGAAREEVRNGR